MKFKSAVDTWFYLLLFVLPTGVLIFVIMDIDTLNMEALALIALVALLALGLPVWLLFSTYYLVESGTLKVRSGPFSWTIPLSEIRSVKPSRSFLSSPALSLNRLEIHYGKGKALLVSPKDQEGFNRAIGQAEGKAG